MQMWKPALKKRLYPHSESCDTGEKNRGSKILHVTVRLLEAFSDSCFVTAFEV